jgi:MFS family permease
MVQIAVAVYVVANHSVATLAVVGLVGSLPALICTPVAGIVADRYDVRRVSMLVMVLQGICVCLLIPAMSQGLPYFAAGYAAQGVVMSFWAPARQHWLYAIVAVGMRHKANAAIGSISGLMTVVGAACGGLLSSWDPAGALAVAAGIQVVACIGVIRTEHPPATDGVMRPERTSALRDLRDGVRAAGRFPLARSIVWIGIAWGFIGGGYTVLLTGRITADLHADAAVLGLVFAADGSSMLVATALAGRVPRRHHLGVYGSAYVLQGLAWAAAFAAPELWLAVGCVVLMRFASGYIIALDTSILLDTVPDRFRGRVTSLHMTTYMAVGRLSLAALSGVLTVASITVVGVITGVSSAVFGIIWWLASGRRAENIYLTAGTRDPV